jgi:hypothetical protein
MRANHVISALVFALAAACADSTSPERGQTGELTAQLRGGSVLLHNGSQQPVHFALNGEEDPTRILWLLCAGPQCPALAPGADDSVALAALDLGGTPSPMARATFARTVSAPSVWLSDLAMRRPAETQR